MKSKNRNEFTDENIALAQYSLINVKTMCPAVILAASRNERVMGRTETLIVSIITRNGLSHSGAPSGRKWAIDFLGLNVKDDNIILNHIGSPIDSVKIKCLDDDSEYGIIPIRLVIIIITNNEVTTDDIPFKLIDIVRDSCLIIVLIIGFNIDSFRCIGFHMCD
jgi:hypothetical protein